MFLVLGLDKRLFKCIPTTLLPSYHIFTKTYYTQMAGVLVFCGGLGRLSSLLYGLRSKGRKQLHDMRYE